MSSPGQPTLPVLMDFGDETEEDQAWPELFAKLEQENIPRLEEAAKMIIQLVMAIYSVLFAILFLAKSPTYLENPTVRSSGVASILSFFVSLGAALVVLLPFRYTYQEDNLTEMKRVYARLLKEKSWGLRVAFAFFLLGSILFGALIITALS
ncbi:MAG: hypothetical protein ACPGWR_26065 [Ardenticatenaceae bacterium]